MNHQFSKRQRAVLRDLAGKAHGRELHKLLTTIAEQVDAWRSGKKEAWDLVEELDKFSKERRSTSSPYRDPALAHFMVARAIVEGLLNDDEVPAEIHSLIAGAISFYRETATKNSEATAVEPNG